MSCAAPFPAFRTELARVLRYCGHDDLAQYVGDLSHEEAMLGPLAVAHADMLQSDADDAEVILHDALCDFADEWNNAWNWAPGAAGSRVDRAALARAVSRAWRNDR